MGRCAAQVAMSAERMRAAVVAWTEVHGLPAPSLPHGVSADEASEDCDGGQQGDPEEVWVALVVGAGR